MVILAKGLYMDNPEVRIGQIKFRCNSPCCMGAFPKYTIPPSLHDTLEVQGLLHTFFMCEIWDLDKIESLPRSGLAIMSSD